MAGEKAKEVKPMRPGGPRGARGPMPKIEAACPSACTLTTVKISKSAKLALTVASPPL